MFDSFLAYAATACFALAVLHTFCVNIFERISDRRPAGSPSHVLFHLLAEVEVSFGLWAGIFIAILAIAEGRQAAVEYLNTRQFTEAVFVFVIMSVCSTRPIHAFASQVISAGARILPLPSGIAVYITALTFGPLLGSVITEPAAMTVVALVLIDRFYKHSPSPRLMYATIGVLFVNVSIGGTLTPYAAPPVLMVASKWNWDLAFMLTHFGWKAALASFLNASATAFFFRKELTALGSRRIEHMAKMPLWVTAVHLLFLVAIVMTHTTAVVFLGFFVFFIGLHQVTRTYQDDLKLREGLLVAFFLGGIIVLGEPQRWWLEPLLRGMDSLTLYAGAIGLTSITDNAALAYLGSQFTDLSPESRYALIAGSVVGGGLTVIANAPNPAGFSLLDRFFGEDGIRPLGLLTAALPYTAVAAIVFWVL